MRIAHLILRALKMDLSIPGAVVINGTALSIFSDQFIEQKLFQREVGKKFCRLHELYEHAKAGLDVKAFVVFLPNVGISGLFEHNGVCESHTFVRGRYRTEGYYERLCDEMVRVFTSKIGPSLSSSGIKVEGLSGELLSKSLDKRRPNPPLTWGKDYYEQPCYWDQTAFNDQRYQEAFVVNKRRSNARQRELESIMESRL